MKRKGLCILAGFFLVAAGAFMSCKGGTATVDPTGEDETATLNGISVTGAKSSFAKGEVFTYSGISVKGTYSDGSKKTIGSKKCTYKIGSTTLTNNVTVLSDVGSFTVTVSYEGFSASYQINVTKYKIPTYDDNYASVSSWSNQSKWNLANTHDPTVIYWPADGYYYMWGTDASYGNEHLKSPSGKHFPGKRSKNLVDWEYVPGPFDSCPEWVNTKLNEIRAQMREEKIAAGETLADDVLQSIDMTTSENAAMIGYWAPCARVITVNGKTKIRMYYSIVADYMIGSGKPNKSENFDGTWSERAFIGVCETTNPSGGPGAWKDLGFVTCSSSDKGTNYSRSSTGDWNAYFYFNAIDPTYFVDDDGTHWMIYGSWHSGFALVQINPSTGKITKDGKTDFKMGKPWASNADGLKANGYGTRIYTRDNSSRWQGSEGPELIKYNGKYYLFFANDPLGVPYQTRVVVADKITGPYLDITGADCTAGNKTTAPLPMITHPYKFSGENDVGYGWVGISHCAIFQAQSDLDGDGEIDYDWFYMSQGRFPENVGGNAYSNALMMGHVRRLEWVPAAYNSKDEDPLWPMVSPERYGGIQKLKANELTAGDIEGTWEHITLTYSKHNMNTSSEAVFKKTSDNGGTVSGALSGKWTFDPETNLLNIESRVVKVEREVDWEKNPTERTVTLVYSGIGASNNTYWGKKVTYHEVEANAIDNFGVYLSSDGNTFDVTSFKINGTEQLTEKKSYVSTDFINTSSAAENANCLVADVGKNEEYVATVSFTLENFGQASTGYQLWNIGIHDITTADTYACILRSDGAYVDSPSSYHSSANTNWNDGSATLSGTWATNDTCNTIYQDSTPITITVTISYDMIKVVVTKSDDSVLSTAVWNRSSN
ncbi:MAG: glycoside hydrolase family 43 protein [Treponema sp.]|nr:glycoside hydrolase family 43 protein [Treponema sp.]